MWRCPEKPWWWWGVCLRRCVCWGLWLALLDWLAEQLAWMSGHNHPNRNGSVLTSPAHSSAEAWCLIAGGKAFIPPFCQNTHRLSTPFSLRSFDTLQVKINPFPSHMFLKQRSPPATGHCLVSTAPSHFVWNVSSNSNVRAQTGTQKAFV